MNQERELQWEDQITKDGPDFILLPEGDYDFTVAKFERARFPGSAKMPACNQAKLEIKVHSPQGDVTLNHSLLLHTKTEGFLSNFFAGIGQKKKGEPLRMNWNAVMGARGRLKLKINTFQKRDGSGEGQSNEIVTFYSHEELAEKGIQIGAPQPQYQQQQYQQPPAQQYQQPAPQQQQFQQPPGQYQQPPMQQQPPQQQAPFPTAPGGYTNGQF